MCLPQALSVSGNANRMVDVLSRSFNVASGYLFSGIELLSHFETIFLYLRTEQRRKLGKK